MGFDISNAVGTAGVGLGIDILGNIMQRGQQQKLTADQIKAQKEMMDYQQKKQLEMWNATGYGAQMKQLKEAGLNPSLLYGKGGGGGQTIGGGIPSITGGVANNKTSAMEAVGMGLNIELQKAQIKAIEADANLKNTQAEKTGGVDTQKTTTEIQSLTQGIENQKAQQKLTQVQEAWTKLQTSISGETREDQVWEIRYQARKSKEVLDQLQMQNDITEATVKDKIKEIRYMAIGAGLRNTLTEAGITNTIQNTEQLKAGVRKINNEILVNWDKLTNENKEIEIKKMLAEWTTSPTREATQQALNLVNQVINATK